MATLTQAETFRRNVDDLVALAMRDLVAFWRQLDTTDARAATEAVRAVVAELGPAYAFAAGGVTADWYDELRDEAQVRAPYRARVAEPPNAERLEILARWSTGSLFGADPDDRLALSKLAGGLQRVVADGSRDTVAWNVREDPAGPMYARHTSGRACAFCRMLATRGPVYRSERTAGGDYHDDCHCVAVPVWDVDAHEDPPYVEEWREQYAAAREEAGGKTKDILREMRRTGGTH